MTRNSRTPETERSTVWTPRQKLSRDVVCVCYPRGDCDEGVKHLARECGYRVGLSTITHTDRSADPLDAHRLLLRPSFSLLEVWLIGRGGYNWLAMLAGFRRWRRRRAGPRGRQPG